jgi:hypothetical protein
MTVEDAIEEHPWKLVSGDAWTPQSAWHFKYLTEAEKREMERTNRNCSIPFQRTSMEKDKDRIKGILISMGKFTGVYNIT